MSKACKVFLATVLLTFSIASAQSRAQSSTQSRDSGLARVVGMAGPTPAELMDESWSQLQDDVTARRGDTRIAALNALSLLGGNARAEQMVRAAMNDPDIDVRLAAIVAAGQMDKAHPQRPSFRNDLRMMVGSDDPKVSFAASTTLWAMHDTSGQDVLVATAEGERVSDYSFLKRSEHNASHTLHSPEALARIAVTQGLVILVPPVGMGMGAYGYLKGAPAASPQVTAIVQLGTVHTGAVQEALIEATRTKDPGARIAAAEALATFPGQEVRDALYPLLMDDKLQVRLTASAAYIRNAGEPHAPAKTRPAGRRRR